MKTTLLVFSLVSAALFSSFGADYTWDTAATGGIQGGSGTWQNAGGPTNWTEDGGMTRVAWANGASNSSTFAGESGGEITIANSITTGTMKFLTSGYSLIASAVRTITVGGEIIIATGSATIGQNVTLSRGNAQIVTGAGTLAIATSGTLISTGNPVAIRGLSTTDTATVVINGGALIASTSINLATATAGGNGVLTINSGSASAVGNIILGDSIGKTATLNLNGGVISAAQIVRTRGNAFFHFNGGILRANSDNAAFMSGEITATVLEGGARVDSNGKAITIGVALAHGGAASLDGGLTKLGAGSLILQGASTYTGTTTVNAGGLEIDNNGTTTARLAATGGITVNSGATFSLIQSGAIASTNRINDDATVTLAGGTFALNGLSEGSESGSGLGNFSLTADSTIDFGLSSGANLLHFEGLGLHTEGAKLSLVNWQNGLDRLLFQGNDASAFAALFTQNDVFFNGVSGYQIISNAGYYEVAAVPEPSIFALAGAGMVGWSLLRRRGRTLE